MSWTVAKHKRASARSQREMARWRLKKQVGRHAPRGGRKPRPVGFEWKHFDLRDGMSWGIGPQMRLRRLARRTVGTKKPKRRRPTKKRRSNG